MKRAIFVASFIAMAIPLSAAKKTTVQQLKDIVVSLNQNRKNDEEIATSLKEIDLTEELTGAEFESLAANLPGPLSQEQLQVLEGRSAILSPPATDLPSTPAPDVVGQKAILARAVGYVTNIYMQNPRLSASKSTARYQDGVEGIRTNSGVTSNMPNVGRSWETPNMFMRFLGSHQEAIENNKGAELSPVAKSKVPWGINGQVSEGGPGPILSVILQEAADGGKLNWLRWETIAGKEFAVFSFAVDKKKSHYMVHYCCFPVTQDTGRMGYEGTGPNFQTGTDWKDFKETIPYHGELFVNPETGAIVRLVTQAELKPTDFVHQEDMRIDYAAIAVGGKTYMAPVDSFTLTEVVPNGDNYAARYSVRHTLFVVSYRNYELLPQPAP